jgi:cyanophycinase
VTPRQRTSQLTSGLGLLPGVIIDQHFDERARYGRLMSLVASSPNLLGMGIDEDTAAEVRDGHRLTVVGSGAVFVVDARTAVSDVPEARRHAPLLISGAVVHSLPSGATFDLHTAQLIGFVEKHPDVVVKASSRGPDDFGHASQAAPQCAN